METDQTDWGFAEESRQRNSRNADTVRVGPSLSKQVE
jgi:hypothetical protein